jgi:RNA polymerase-binding transcription factor DksA
MTTTPETITEVSKTDLAHYEAVLLEQRRFRLQQIAELSPVSPTRDRHAASAEIADVLERAARHALAEVDQALERLRAARYGRCVDCDQAISRDRLDVLPSAARCLACQSRVGTSVP